MENELAEERKAKEMLQEDNEMLKMKIKKLEKKNRRLKEERIEVLGKNTSLEEQLNEKAEQNGQLMDEVENSKAAMQVFLTNNTSSIRYLKILKS